MQSSQGYSFQKTPKSVSISITGACNLHCRYCFYNNEMERLKDLSTGQWLAFFETLRQLAVCDVSLTGGEALLRPDIFELIDGIIANRMRYSLLSNGTKIDESVIDTLSTVDVRAITSSCMKGRSLTAPSELVKGARGMPLGGTGTSSIRRSAP